MGDADLYLPCNNKLHIIAMENVEVFEVVKEAERRRAVCTPEPLGTGRPSAGRRSGLGALGCHIGWMGWEFAGESRRM